MVQVRKSLILNSDHSINVKAWMDVFSFPAESFPAISQAVQFAKLIGGDQLTQYGTTCFEQGLEIAEILMTLNFCADTVIAGLIYSSFSHTDISIDDIGIQLGSCVASLLRGVRQLDIMNDLGSERKLQSRQQLDNIRKMFLAMVADVRVVVLKLVERLSMMRSIRSFDAYARYQISQETMAIFAPLANRLGLHEIKWELEDLAFHDLEPKHYERIAKNLAERRIDREKRVAFIESALENVLEKAHITGKVYGRAKHIYSIHKKMLRKNVNYSKIYDVIALRVLVNTIEECYTTLSLIHQMWQFIPDEFDDYIATPKPNGYQSIHTVLIDADGQVFEVQIRTYQMHEEAEEGGAAHWIYKEGAHQTVGYEQKIAWLRQLLDWQQQLVHDTTLPKTLEENVFEDRVYVFTPAGDIVDLPVGSTPLDFAYYIHTEIGHRCRGAKVNTKMVPLTYLLKTTDRVEILTAKGGVPSRDWLRPDQSYLRTSSARAKVLQWFKKEDETLYVARGKTLLEQELIKLAAGQVDLNLIARRLDYCQVDKMLAAIGNGHLRLSRVIQVLSDISGIRIAAPKDKEIITSQSNVQRHQSDQIEVLGIDHLLSRIAKCCKPVPGDPIIGYITRGQGISIHHKNCNNLVHIGELQQNRLIPVNWSMVGGVSYPVDLSLILSDRSHTNNLLGIFRDEKIVIIRFNTIFLKDNEQLKILVTVEVDSVQVLNKLISRLHQLSYIVNIRRV